MSSRNLPTYRHSSYMEPHLTDDESSESIGSYMDDLDIRRNKHDRRDSAGRSIRSSRQSSKSSPHRSFDEEDSEGFSRRSYRQSARERRANSLARSVSSRPERRSSRVRSDSTQDSETEVGTRALVQAKIREKVARAESLDGSSSDLWKPKPISPQKTEKHAEKVASVAAASTPEVAPTNQTASTNKLASKPTKVVSKPATERRKSVESTPKPKTSTEAQKLVKPTTKLTAKSTTIKTSTAAKSTEQVEPVKKEDSAAIKTPEAEKVEVSEPDLANLPDTVPEGPPKTPDYEWTCEHCTFENEANVKICAVCCKTPSSGAIRKQQTNSENEKDPKLNGKPNDSADVAKEGRGKRISRKISFWPGTKPT